MLKKIIQIIKLYNQGHRTEAVRETRKGYVKYKMRVNRGETLFDIIESPAEAMLIKGGILVLFLEKIADKLGVVVPLWCWFAILPALYLTQQVARYYSGRFDQKKLHLWEIEHDWASKNVSPWEQEKMRLLKKLDKGIDI